MPDVDRAFARGSTPRPSSNALPVSRVAPSTRDAAPRARVLLVAPQPFFTVRGTPINVLRMARVLCGAGYEVHLATYPIGDTVPVDGLTYHRSPRIPGVRHVAIGFSGRKLLLDASLALRVWQLQLAQRFDIVHAVEESVFLALPLAMARGIPVIYDLDSMLSDQLSYSGVIRHPRMLRAVRAIERVGIRRSAAALTVCSALTDAVRELEPRAHVVQIEDCVETQVYQTPSADMLATVGAELALDGAPVAMYVGNLEPYQGIDLLLDAWRLVHDGMPNARLVIAGGDARSIGALRQTLATLGAAGQTVVVAGPQPPERLPALLALATVLVSPRRAGENTPLKLYGYMASGTPIVATNIRTHTQVLDASTAVLTSPDGPSLARALIDVLRHPSAHRVLGAAALERVQARYSAREFARKLLDAYSVILGHAQPPRVA